MLSIQEAGQQILRGNPGKFYIFVGQEFGIKTKYLESLVNHYNGEYVEIESVNDVLSMMRTKHLIPLTPKLYIARYDEDFIQSISDSTFKNIESTKIIGTIVCIYESPKHSSKCSKHLSNYTVSFDAVNTKFIKKYLISDFPNLDVKLIDFAINHRPDYKGAWNICNSLAYADISKSSYDDKTLSKTFGCIDSTTENQFRIGIASRNFAYSLSILESYSDNIDQIFYAILNTMLELEKLMDNKYAQSDIKEYVSNWTKPDIYNMFMNTYEELKKVRSHSSYKVENSIIYLLGLLQFKYIPSVEVML